MGAFADTATEAPAQPVGASYRVTASSYEPFVRDLRRIAAPSEWFIERVPTDAKLAAAIDRWKRMAACGWDVTALVAPDSKTVIALGCRGPA